MLLLKTIRSIFIVILAACFGTMGYFLYEKQKNQHNYSSFKISQDADAVLFLNLDRLLKRVQSVDDLNIDLPNFPLTTGIKSLVENNTTEVSHLIGNSCFVSFNETDFNLAFNKVLNIEDVLLFLQELNIVANYKDGLLTILDHDYVVQFFDNFTSIGSVKKEPLTNQPKLETGNVDYIVFVDSTKVEKHLLTKDQSFKLWSTAEKPVRGRPVLHKPFIEKVPLSFEQITFYGSSRFQEDRLAFFQETSEESMAWIDNGVLIIQKDSFQIMIAQQNDSRDLKLMLEEQTLSYQNDSSGIAYFNIKNFEIMTFKSEFAWHEVIPALNKQLNYYTEIENFNVMANSIAAMRWYLAEIQIDNLFLRSEDFKKRYKQSLPLYAHMLNVNISNTIDYKSATWREKNKATHTFTSILLNGKSEGSDDVLFPIDFKPIYIQLIEKNGDLLITGTNKVTYITASGVQKWMFESKHPIKQKLQIIDIENNGKSDFALFNTNGMIVLDNKGKAIERLTLQNETEFKEGICLNYDNSYDYRFLLINGDRIDYFNENGQIVEGWQFKQSTTPINTVLHYTQIQGKDYISFKDISNNQYILNRRGENRFPNLRQFDLPNESVFLTGNNEAEMRKIGYNNQYILSYFVKDGYLDSVKLDKRVNPLEISWLEENGNPLLVIEEASRIMIFNTFGYLETEILKPEGMGEFLGVHKKQGFNYVFFNNSQNSLYLLDKGGKLRVKTNKTHSLYGISAAIFCTYDGQNIKLHKLN